MIHQETWEHEIAPGLPAGVALSRLRLYLAALEAAGIDITTTPIGGGGARASARQEPRRYDDADLRALVDAKWEAIKAGRLADAARVAPRAPVVSPEPASVSLQPDSVSLTGPSVTPAADVAAAPALLPGAAQRARDARRRDDEEALILLLLES